MIRDYVRTELIWLNQEFTSREQMFANLADYLLDKGYVNEKYYRKLIERERNYPTGLELDGYYVAIPHSDVDCIERPFIAIATLVSPINMYKMDDPKTSVPVQTFFFLGLDDEQTHLKILKEFIKLIQDKSFIKYIQQSNSVDEVNAKVSYQVMVD